MMRNVSAASAMMVLYVYALVLMDTSHQRSVSYFKRRFIRSLFAYGSLRSHGKRFWLTVYFSMKWDLSDKLVPEGMKVEFLIKVRFLT